VRPWALAAAVGVGAALVGVVLAPISTIALVLGRESVTNAALASFVYDAVLFAPGVIAASLVAARLGLGRAQCLLLVLMPLLVEAALVALFGRVPAGFTDPWRAGLRCFVIAAAVAVLWRRRQPLR
jgi:hypothetical protein